MSRIYLVRHGQASLEQGGAGSLTPTGVRQCEALARHWRAIGRHMDLVFAGTLPRQLESAAAFVHASAAQADAAAAVRQLPGIEEYDHVALIAAHAGPAGIPRDARDLHGRLVPALHAWVEDRLEGVERFVDFRARCSAALATAIGITGRGRQAVLFASAGSLAAAMQSWLGVGDRDLLRLKLTFYNTGVSCLLSDGERVTIESVNTIGHLEQPGLLPLVTHR
ncbi:MAG TPA: histidine phosphatase family protein [Steroidobacteraceae bacterium]|jgi:broad specificity phosphatase PhoE